MHDAERIILDDIRRKMESIAGHTGFYYRNLVSGYEYNIRSDDVFGAASVIKLPLFMHVYKLCDEGLLSMEQTVTVDNEDKVPICGALTLFTGPVSTDIRTLCKLMISISDNTATNVLIDRCGLSSIHSGFRQMGLHKTQLNRKLFDHNASAAGIRNLICLREIGELLSMLYRESYISANVSKEIIETLQLQQVDHKLNGRICGEVSIAHKTGEDDHLSNDVGIVYAPEPFVICFAGENTDVYLWEDLIRNAAYDLYKAQMS